MVKEFDYPEIRNSSDWDEHSVASRAKKVIPGPTSFEAIDENKHRSIAPIVGDIDVTANDLVLLQGKAYRIISDSDLWFILKDSTASSGTAVKDEDIYLPAKTPLVIKTDRWMVFNYVGSNSSGCVQAVQVL
jgi:hypothetical protein